MRGQYREQFSEPRLRDALALLNEDYDHFKESPCEFRSTLRVVIMHMQRVSHCGTHPVCEPIYVLYTVRVPYCFPGQRKQKRRRTLSTEQSAWARPYVCMHARTCSNLHHTD